MINSYETGSGKRQRKLPVHRNIQSTHKLMTMEVIERVIQDQNLMLLIGHTDKPGNLLVLCKCDLKNLNGQK